MNLNKQILEDYVEAGWLIKQSHPTLPLSIYNYSQATQYESKWDEVTLSCRGVITDDTTGKVLIKPFSKFFNYEEVPNEVPWLTSDYVYVQEKMDGSLGILFNYNGEWIMATRGSFASEQAIKGLEILKSKYNLDTFEKSIAYICEIIYPKNRIVVKYNEERVVFLGAVLNRSFNWNETGEDELHWTTAKAFFKSSGIKIEDTVKTEQVFKEHLGHDLYKKLKEFNTQNKEGFVLRFFPSNTRVKIKFEDYIALHRILTNVSSYDIWENLMKFGKLPEEMLKDVPDEFYNWVHKTEHNIRANFNKIKTLAYFEFDQVFDKVVGHPEFDKVFALEVISRKNSGLLFSIKNGKSIDQAVWKMVKPTYEKPFNL